MQSESAHVTPQGARDALTERIIGAALEVHKALGPGLLESAYSECLAYELSRRGLRFEREISIPIRYKGVLLDCGYRLDFVVEDEVVIEVKSVERLEGIHEAQLLTYLRLCTKRVGLVINFNVELLRDGIKRRVL